MTKEQIHNIYLHMTGKAEGLLEAGVEADFPVMFAEAIMEYNKSCKLTDDEIDEVWAETCSDFKLIENGKTKGIINIYDVSRAILKKASEK